MGSAFWPVDNKGKYRIDLGVGDANGQMQNINILCDSGNDITILTTATAHRLGFDPPQEQGEVFPVGGITAGPQDFKKIQNIIRIGQLAPIWVPIGLAFQQQSLYEDLLGRAGIWDSGIYSITQDERGITFTEKQMRAMVTYGPGRISQAQRAALRLW